MMLIPVTKEIRWFQLFGKTGQDMPEDTRRARWEEWKGLLIADGEQEIADRWSKDHVEETCAGCRHKDGDWCKLVGLPCNVNPVLTFSRNWVGMACRGAGYNEDLVQGTLF